jgi:hypothetical protein
MSQYCEPRDTTRRTLIHAKSRDYSRETEPAVSREVGFDVRYWHKADIGLRGLNVCFGGKADIVRTRKSCLLLTQSGHFDSTWRWNFTVRAWH